MASYRPPGLRRSSGAQQYGGLLPPIAPPTKGDRTDPTPTFDDGKPPGTGEEATWIPPPRGWPGGPPVGPPGDGSGGSEPREPPPPPWQGDPDPYNWDPFFDNSSSRASWWQDQLSGPFLDRINNPSRYDADLVRQGGDVIREQIEDMKQRGKIDLEEHYASRGLTGSSLESDQMAEYTLDLQALEAQRLWDLQREQANTWADDWRAAAGAGLGAGGLFEQTEGRQVSDGRQARALQLHQQGMEWDEAFRQSDLEWRKEAGRRGLDISEEMGRFNIEQLQMDTLIRILMNNPEMINDPDIRAILGLEPLDDPPPPPPPPTFTGENNDDDDYDDEE